MLLLCVLFYLLFFVFFNRFHKRKFIRRKPYSDTWFKTRKKPTWVVNKIVHFKAMMPDDGCRKLAATFNRQFGDRESVSKSWVCNIIRKYQYEIAMKRRQIRNEKPADIPINKTWGMDMTGKHDENGSNQQILGIIGHGSRASIVLKYIESKSSLFLLGEIFRAGQKYEKPKFIRTDNEVVFTIT